MSSSAGGTALARLRRTLAAGGVDTAAIDARLLMQAVTGLDRNQLILNENLELTADQAAQIEAYAARRIAGEPVTRILGEGSFYGRAYRLGSAILDPRQDTEVLVETVVALIKGGRGQDGRGQGGRIGADADTSVRIADIGTGSGIIAVTLLAELPTVTGVATDIAEEAVAVARHNAELHGVAERLTFRTGSYLEALEGEGRFHVIASNPPYIASAVVDGLDRSVLDHDPRRALDGGADGLDAYRVLTAGAGEHLQPGGWLVVEIGFDQGAAVAGLFAAAGFEAIEVIPDLGGRDRVVLGRLGGSRRRAEGGPGGAGPEPGGR